MLVDANLLLFAVDRSSPFHEAAAWLTGALNGARRVGIPWPSLAAFLRISTNPRASEHPPAPEDAWPRWRSSTA
jgi:predicted nucleic acid-binding protein